MNLTQARQLLKQIIPNPDTFYTLTRKKDSFVLIVRELTGWQLGEIQKHFSITYLLGEEWDYGDILIKMRPKEKLTYEEAVKRENKRWGFKK